MISLYSDSIQSVSKYIRLTDLVKMIAKCKENYLSSFIVAFFSIVLKSKEIKRIK